MKIMKVLKKTVTLTIKSSMNALPFIIGGVGIVGVGAILFFVIKKKKNNYWRYLYGLKGF